MNGPVNLPSDYEQVISGWNKPPSNWWIFFFILIMLGILLWMINKL